MSTLKLSFQATASLSCLAIFTMLLAIPLTVFAQVAVISPVSNQDFLALLAQSIGGLKGAGSLVVTGVMVQLLMKFVGTPWADDVFQNAGPWKLTLMSILSLVSGVLGLMTAGGLTLVAALVHSTTLVAFMVLANNIYKQFFVKGET